MSIYADFSLIMMSIYCLKKEKSVGCLNQNRNQSFNVYANVLCYSFGTLFTASVAVINYAVWNHI